MITDQDILERTMIISSQLDFCVFVDVEGLVRCSYLQALLHENYQVAVHITSVER